MDILNTAPQATQAATRAWRLSIVVPVFNEDEVLPEFHRRLSLVLDTNAIAAEIVYVNDGSRDRTIALLLELHRTDPRVAVVDLSRNFGKEVAMSAGLDHATGEAVIVMDVDLQDPPELIPEMIAVWQSGCDIVMMRRRSRSEEGWLKRTTAHTFYRTLRTLAAIDIPENIGDFRLMSRRAVDAVRSLPERSRFMKGIFAWVGFPSRTIDYDRVSREAGRTKWNYWRLWNFALEGITSFSATPLKLASYIGLVSALAAFAYAVYVIVKTMLFGDPVQGYPTLVVLVLFLGGIQLMALGIIGEYLARMFVEVKQRPLYFVQRVLPAAQVPAAVDARPPPCP